MLIGNGRRDTPALTAPAVGWPGNVRTAPLAVTHQPHCLKPLMPCQAGGVGWISNLRSSGNCHQVHTICLLPSVCYHLPVLDLHAGCLLQAVEHTEVMADARCKQVVDLAQPDWTLQRVQGHA